MASDIQTSPPMPADRQTYALLEEQAARIQHHIHQLQQELASIRVTLNSLMPVNRIPDDVLLEIFALLVQSASPGLTNVGLHCDLTTVSHVCGRWRSVAVNNPTLWTEIPLHSLERAALFLERSQLVPVRVSLDRWRLPRDPLGTEYSQLIAPQIPRLRALFLHNIYHPQHMAWWMTQLTAPAPLLEELSLSLGTALSYDEVPIADRRVSMFSDDAPALRTLSLHQVVIPSSSQLYQHLRYLSLSSQMPGMLSISELIDILRRAAGLEILLLGNINFNPTDSGDALLIQDHTPVALNHLSTLEIKTIEWGGPHPILAHLALPVTTRFRLDIGFANLGDILLPQNPVLIPALFGLRALEVVFRLSPHDLSFTLHARRHLSVDTPPSLSLSARPCDQPPATLVHNLSRILDTSALLSYKITIENANAGYVPGTPIQQRWDAALRGLEYSSSWSNALAWSTVHARMH